MSKKNVGMTNKKLKIEVDELKTQLKEQTEITKSLVGVPAMMSSLIKEIKDLKTGNINSISGDADLIDIDFDDELKDDDRVEDDERVEDDDGVKDDESYSDLVASTSGMLRFFHSFE